MHHMQSNILEPGHNDGILARRPITSASPGYGYPEQNCLNFPMTSGYMSHDSGSGHISPAVTMSPACESPSISDDSDFGIGYCQPAAAGANMAY